MEKLGLYTSGREDSFSNRTDVGINERHEVE